jgi:hypothetical protein
VFPTVPESKRRRLFNTLQYPNPSTRRIDPPSNSSWTGSQDQEQYENEDEDDSPWTPGDTPKGVQTDRSVPSSQSDETPRTRGRPQIRSQKTLKSIRNEFDTSLNNSHNEDEQRVARAMLLLLDYIDIRQAETHKYIAYLKSSFTQSMKENNERMLQTMQRALHQAGHLPQEPADFTAEEAEVILGLPFQGTEAVQHVLRSNELTKKLAQYMATYIPDNNFLNEAFKKILHPNIRHYFFTKTT